MPLEEYSSVINLFVTDHITDDVAKGIQLYGLATGEMVSDNAASRAQRWLAVFRENPMGGGLFAIAKHRDEVIGFFSIIDIEMSVRGRAVRAGKAEFFVIKEEMRKVVLPGTSVSLPWAMFQRLRAEAKNYGYQIILTLPSQAASIFPRLSGDLRLQTQLATFRVPGEVDERVGRVGRYAAKLLGFRTLAATRSRLHRCIGASAIGEVVQLEEMPRGLKCVSDNSLISLGAEMLRFRFPADRYVNYLLEIPGRAPLLFVFDRPVYRGSVSLVHWSGLPEAFEQFAAVLVAILDLVRREKAHELVIEIPIKQLPENYRFEEYGFVRQKSRADNDCYLLDTNKQLQLKKVSDWHITHGHKGYYSWRT